MAKQVLAPATWDGNLPRLDDPRRYRLDAKAQKWPVGKQLLIKVAPVTRSERANAYYWSTVLKQIEERSESGNSVEELHDAFCERFIVTERKQVEFFSRLTGETLTTEIDHRRSSALTGAPFYDFVENVREFARTFWGVETDDPDPDYWRKKKHEAATREPENTRAARDTRTTQFSTRES